MARSVSLAGSPTRHRTKYQLTLVPDETSHRLHRADCRIVESSPYQSARNNVLSGLTEAAPSIYYPSATSSSNHPRVAFLPYLLFC